MGSAEAALQIESVTGVTVSEHVAHEVVASLPTNVGIAPPENEAQARALGEVPADQRATVLTEAREEGRRTPPPGQVPPSLVLR